MKKLLFSIFLVLIWCNIANAKTFGEGELQLTDRSVKDFIRYIRGKGNKTPLNFYVTLNGAYATYWYCGSSNCSFQNVGAEIDACEKSSSRTCERFARGKYVKWKNGINPGKGKASKFSSKMTDTQIRKKLNELGFYNNKKKIIETKEQKAAKEKKLADKKAAKEKKLADKKAAEEKKLADKKAAKEKKLADKKAAEEKKLADEKAAKEKKLADEKAVEEKLVKKLSLIPAETDLEKAQNFIKNVQEFIKFYPDEFDIIKLAEFFIIIKPIVDGDLNYKSKKDLEQFKEFTNTSDLFVKYNNDIEKGQRDKNLNKINDAILSLENNIKIIKGFLVMDQNSIYLEEWLGSIKNALIVIDNPSSYDQLLTTNDDLIKLIKQK